MAKPLSASAQSCICQANVPESRSAPEARELLKLQACDDADSLREVLGAYACLEKLVAPTEVGETEEINPTRSELAALLRVVNQEFGRRIESVEKAVRDMCPL